MSTPLPPPTPPPYPLPPPGPSNPFDREHHPSTVDRLDQDPQRPAASACGDAEVRGASPAAAPHRRGGVDAGKGRPPTEMHNPSPGAGGPGTAPTDASNVDAGGTAQGGTPDALRASHPDPPDLRPGAVLARAADLIAAHGLARNRFVDVSGRLCVLGALLAACGLDPAGCGHALPQLLAALDKAAQPLRGHLRRHGEAGHNLARWSDSHPAEHVIARMREAAATVDGDAR